MWICIWFMIGKPGGKRISMVNRKQINISIWLKRSWFSLNSSYPRRLTDSFAYFISMLHFFSSPEWNSVGDIINKACHSPVHRESELSKGAEMKFDTVEFCNGNRVNYLWKLKISIPTLNKRWVYVLLVWATHTESSFKVQNTH